MDDFGAFYARSRDAVLRAVVVASGGGHAAAEDAVAEAYTRACDRWDTVREHPNPTAWVLRTALNCQRSWWRRLVREVPGPVPERPVASADETYRLPVVVRELVAGLPRRQREVLALRVLADLSAEETGRLLGIAPATVHVHLHRALSALRAGLPLAERKLP